MATGDLQNNLRKLKAEIKAIKYEGNVDIDSIAKGLPQSFLPLYHCAFVDYSRRVAEQLQEIGVELSGKTDQRFMDGVYKILRELYTYRPAITKDQFFKEGFAEKKVIMCKEVLHMVHERHKTLGPKPKPKPAPSVKHHNTSLMSSVMSKSMVTYNNKEPTKAKPTIREAQDPKQNKPIKPKKRFHR